MSNLSFEFMLGMKRSTGELFVFGEVEIDGHFATLVEAKVDTREEGLALAKRLDSACSTFLDVVKEANDGLAIVHTTRQEDEDTAPAIMSPGQKE